MKQGNFRRSFVNERERDGFHVAPIDEIDLSTIIVDKVQDDGAVKEILVNGEDEIADQRFCVTEPEWRRIVDGPIDRLLICENKIIVIFSELNSYKV